MVTYFYFSLRLALKHFEWPVIPVAAVSRLHWLIAADTQHYPEKQQRVEIGAGRDTGVQRLDAAMSTTAQATPLRLDSEPLK